MSGRSSRRKGHEEERKVAAELRDLGFEAETTRSNNRARDFDGVDVIARSESFALAVQVKRGRSPRVRAALSEAVAGADDNEMPMAVVSFLDRRRPRRLLVLDMDSPYTRRALRRMAWRQE